MTKVDSYTDVYYQIINHLWKTIKPYTEQLDDMSTFDDGDLEDMANVPNEIETVPIIVLYEGFDDAAKACGAAVTTDKGSVKFFITTDKQVIFLDGSNKC